MNLAYIHPATMGEQDMAGILCRANGVPHRHDTAEHVRACHGAAAGIATPPTTPPVRPNDGHPGRRVVRTQDDPTEKQIDFIRSLGGDAHRARHMTRLGASQYIQQLKAAKENRPVTDVPAARPAPRPTTIVPIDLLKAVRDGRYAFRPDANTKWSFVRISRPKNGRMKDCIKIQTQHGDDLTDRMTVYPSGHVWLPAPHMIESVLLGIIVDQTQCAIDYGREIGRCCRCGKSLTDERSRHYGIGPECEKVWPHLIDTVDEASGGSFEYLWNHGLIQARVDA